MTDKPAPERIARDLRRLLYGKANPSDDDYAQCRTMNVSYPDFAKMCGYAEPKDIPEDPNLYDAVATKASEIDLIVGFGAYTVLVGGDFHCKPAYPDYDWPESS